MNTNLQLDAQIAAQDIFDSLTKTTGINCVWGIMRTDDFINLRDFPMNRDTAKRIKSNRNTHLQGGMTSSQQFNVAVVVTNEGINPRFHDTDSTMMKIDGHSRVEAWKTGKLAKPEKLNVQFFFDIPDAQIIKEYSVFNDSLSQATAAEHTTIYNKLNEFEPVSGFCKKSWKEAFKKMEYDEYEEGLKTHLSVLKEIDKWGIKPDVGKSSTGRHGTGVKIALLKSKDKGTTEQWGKFWGDFFSDESDIESVKDLRKLISTMPSNKPMTIHNHCMDAYEKYKND